MNKKSQAALEFLMTYGLAIIVVLIAIGALAYFGILSPCKFSSRIEDCKEKIKDVQTCYYESYSIKPVPYTCNQVAQALLLGIELDVKVQSYKICRNINGTGISNQTDGDIYDTFFENIKTFYRDECLLK